MTGAFDLVPGGPGARAGKQSHFFLDVIASRHAG
jgi:hypothetical protein